VNLKVEFRARTGEDGEIVTERDAATDWMLNLIIKMLIKATIRSMLSTAVFLSIFLYSKVYWN
jgi:hypothetical protein